jgi:hypothetical protein
MRKMVVICTLMLALTVLWSPLTFAEQPAGNIVDTTQSEAPAPNTDKDKNEPKASEEGQRSEEAQKLITSGTVTIAVPIHGANGTPGR